MASNKYDGQMIKEMIILGPLVDLHIFRKFKSHCLSIQASRKKRRKELSLRMKNQWVLDLAMFGFSLPNFPFSTPFLLLFLNSQLLYGS